jgi:hypothetical protein
VTAIAPSGEDHERSPSSLALQRQSSRLPDAVPTTGCIGVSPESPTGEQSSTSSEMVTCCPHRRGWWWVNTATGEEHRDRCRRDSCCWCAAIKARQIGFAITHARPERAIRLSLVGDEWRGIQRNVNRMMEKLRGWGLAWEMAWHVEPNPRRTGFHVHAWQKGSYVEQPLLQQVCASVGIGIPYIERVRQQRGPMLYGLKSITNNRLHRKEAERHLHTYREANGNRLVHKTHRFFLDEHGQPCGIKKGIYAARRDLQSDEGWQLIFLGDVSAADLSTSYGAA